MLIRIKARSDLKKCVKLENNKMSSLTSAAERKNARWINYVLSGGLIIVILLICSMPYSSPVTQGLLIIPVAISAYVALRARKNAVNVLKIRDQLEKVTDSVPGVIYSFRLNLDGSYSFPYYNPMLNYYVGLPDVDLTRDGSPAFSRIHPEDLTGIHESIAASAEKLSLWQKEFRVLHPEKGQIWLEGRSVPSRESNGSTIWHGYLSDISLRKRAEDLLCESEKLYRNKEATLRALLDSITDLVFIKDMNLAYLGCNKAFEIYSGMSEADLIGKTDFDITSPAMASFYQGKDREMFASGKPLQIEEWIPFKHGGGGQFDTLKTPFYGPDGRLLGLIGISRNITHRKIIERSLHLQSAALNAADEAVVITRRDGTIEWVNQSFTNTTGYSADEVIGRNPRTLIKSGRQNRAFYTDMWNTILDGRVWRGEVINRRKNGSLYTEVMTITPVRDAHGDIAHFIAIKRDITEQKKLESQMFRTQRMESVGRLASGIAHDLNNILSPILLGATLLRDMTKNTDSLDIIDSIEAGAGRGAEIIKQLLTFSRGADTPRTPVKLCTMARDMIKLMDETFPKNITIPRINADSPHLVLGNSTQIHQVIMNLCMNARDAMPNGGELALSLSTEDVDDTKAKLNNGARTGRHVVLTVKDTGAGIEPELMDKVFDPFFTTKNVGEGTGLGLYNVLGIVRSHNGFIQVDSQPGEGTEFRVYFPTCEKAEPDVNDSESDLLSKGGGESILIVDDEENLRRMFRRILELNGYKVLEAHHGAAALTVLEGNEHPVKLVLTDLVMPVMDGHTLIKTIHQNHPDVKIISMSGNITQPEMSHILEADTHAFLTKPFSATTLMNTLQQVLAR